MANQLHAARLAKDDEFYTQYSDIEKEMNSYIEYNQDVFRDKIILCPCDDPEWSNFTKYFSENFERFGLKKLISTSYAKGAGNNKISSFEMNSPNGKIFILNRDTDNSGKVDYKNIEFEYLQGDGDFRSDEVKKLRDQADVIITNPPFSLFREFLAWIMEAEKLFSIIGNQNVYTDKDVFPLIKSNKIWSGTHTGDMAFKVPDDSEPRKTRYWQDETGQKWRSIGNATWLTNMEHNVRHTKLSPMTMEDNLKYNKRLRRILENKFGEIKYPKYDNYDAIEVPLSNAIPSNYDGVMGVPITFLDKYNPEQFELIGMTANGAVPAQYKLEWNKPHNNPFINGKAIYQRILVKRKGNIINEN
jgi:hypothetical protein